MLLEIRIGSSKKKLSSINRYVKEKCSLPARKIHRVPHITLFGNFDADHRQFVEVTRIFESVSKKYDYFTYFIDGFNWCDGDKGKVIYYNVVPSKELKCFRQEIASNLEGIVRSDKPWDHGNDFLFHSTVAYKLTNSEFRRTWSFITGKQNIIDRFLCLFKKPNESSLGKFYLPSFALRATLLNNVSKIAYEYDFLQKKLLPRQEALSKSQWQRTLQLFRIKEGMQNCSDNNTGPYFISDLHLDHANIINYCSRPFIYSDVDEMNEVLVNNWNSTVKNNVVYFLGDLSFGRGSRSADVWLEKLSGRVSFIRGNHETARNSKEYEILECNGRKFLLVHNPDYLPVEWDDWVIHGHKHNNEVKDFPFINGKKKTINVSAELINYKPVSLNYILNLGLDSIERMDTVNSTPIKK
jgi:calcineurin-like phosphoesterase family protein/2'-5' RNA ligase